MLWWQKSYNLGTHIWKMSALRSLGKSLFSESSLKTQVKWTRDSKWYSAFLYEAWWWMLRLDSINSIVMVLLHTLELYILSFCLGVVLFPINSPLYLCQDPFELQRLRSNGNQPELSSLTRLPAGIHVSWRRSHVWLTALWKCHLEHVNSLSRRFSLRVEGQQGQLHHLYFSWTSVSIRLDPTTSFWHFSLLLSTKGHHFALHSFSVPCVELLPCLSLLSSFSFGIRSQADFKTGALY